MEGKLSDSSWMVLLVRVSLFHAFVKKYISINFRSLIISEGIFFILHSEIAYWYVSSMKNLISKHPYREKLPDQLPQKNNSRYIRRKWYWSLRSYRHGRVQYFRKNHPFSFCIQSSSSPRQTSSSISFQAPRTTRSLWNCASYCDRWNVHDWKKHAPFHRFTSSRTSPWQQRTFRRI